MDLLLYIYALPLHSYHLARYICFNRRNVTVSDHETETILNRNLFNILCTRSQCKAIQREEAETVEEDRRKKKTHTHQLRICVDVGTQSGEFNWTKYTTANSSAHANGTNEYMSSLYAVCYWEITIRAFQFDNDFSALCSCFSNICLAMFHLDLLHLQRNVSNGFNLLKTVCRRNIFESFPPPYHYSMHHARTGKNIMQFMISACIIHTQREREAEHKT